MKRNNCERIPSCRKLPETYIIFVTQNDTLGYGLPIAHIDRTIKENGRKKGTARNLENIGMPIEQIAQVLKVSVQLVQEWLAGSASAAK